MVCICKPEGKGLFASPKPSLTIGFLEKSQRSASAQHFPVAIHGYFPYGLSAFPLGACLHRHPSALGAPQPVQKLLPWLSHVPLEQKQNPYATKV